MTIAALPSHPRFVNHTGRRFGKLVVVEFAGKIGGKKTPLYAWLCLCDCGLTKIIASGTLVNATRSCGCMATTKTHGAAGGKGTSEYHIWTAMKARCYRSSDPAFGRYGGRGITICARRKNSFETFLADMGPRPSKSHSIDRFPNNDGNYEPDNWVLAQFDCASTDNCRWATSSEQMRNMRRNRTLTINGETKCLTDWAKHAGINPGLVSQRFLTGRSPEECIAPSGSLRKRYDYE